MNVKKKQLIIPMILSLIIISTAISINAVYKAFFRQNINSDIYEGTNVINAICIE